MKRILRKSLLLPHLLAVCLLSCENTTVNDKKNRGHNGKLQVEPDLVFKGWVKDTLETFNSWQKQAEKGVEKKHVILEEDSLSLTIEAFYNETISGNQKSGRISDLISLLKEYGELPSNSFKLSFLYQDYYYPSSIKEKKYDFTYEVKNVKVVEGDSIEKRFGFVRGRLTGVEVFNKNHPSRPSLKSEFIWDGDKLIKVPR